MTTNQVVLFPCGADHSDAALKSGKEKPVELGPVLVVEDEPNLRKTIVRTLRKAGHEVNELAGLAGICAAMEREPKLVLLDAALGTSDAVEVIQTLSAKGFRGVVQLISGGSASLLEEIRKVGDRNGIRMLPPLRKPFRMKELHERLAEVATALAAEPTISSSPVASAARPQVDLAQALDSDWLQVWYQPKYDMKSGMIVGAECLSRISHPTAGIVLPGAFLPDATIDDLRRLTVFVLRQACHDWHDFNAHGKPLRLALNLPTSLISDQTFLDQLRKSVADKEGWPGLIVEITEEEALDDIKIAHESAVQLQIYGVDLAIDDFGMGYSCLARLRELPFKEIKLDRSLVNGASGNEVNAAMCRSIIEIAHVHGAIAVAEGIERFEDMVFLKEAGCDLAQGFLLGRPMPKNRFLDHIDQVASIEIHTRDSASHEDPGVHIAASR